MSSSPETRFTEYTATDHQAPLWIATSMTIAYAGVFLVVRLIIKAKVLGLDDLFIGVAHVMGFAQWAVMFAALHDGVGKDIDGSSLMAAARLVYISRILTLLTLGLSKCSVLLFLRQVFVGTVNKGWTVCSMLLVGTACWTALTVLATSASCHPSGALLPQSESQCAGDLTRWGIVVGLDVFAEILLIIIPALLFEAIHISRSKKFILFGAFLPRIAVPAIFIAYLLSYMSFRKHGGSSLSAVSTLVWQQVLCGYCLISATTPCLKGFLGRFRTEDLARVTDGSISTQTYGTNRSRTNQESFTMRSLDHKSGKKAARPTDEPIPLVARPPALSHSAIAYADFADNGDGSVKSFGSDRMMIHQKVEFDVTSL